MTAHDDASDSDERNWDALRGRLERERAEIIDQLEMPADDLLAVTATTGQGETEHIVSEVEQSVQAVLDAAAIERLADLNDALRRLDEGTYGICERCGAPIPMARLEALPHVRLCVQCQGADETQRRR
jgi:RNA polymerase-binding transcription factor DksA